MKELTVNAATLVYPYANEISCVLWSSLRDHRLSTRNAAIEALRAIIRLMQQRDLAQLLVFYEELYDEAFKGLKFMNFLDPKIIDGSLLAFHELLIHAPLFMRDKMNELCDLLFRIYEIEGRDLRESLFSLLPTIASYNSILFSDRYLETSMNMLMNYLRQERDKSLGFLNSGRLAEIIGKNISKFVGSILEIAKREIESNGQGEPSGNTLAAIQCWTSFAKVLGEELAEPTLLLLPYIFDLSLNEISCQALATIAESIASLRDKIFDNLQDLIRESFARSQENCLLPPTPGFFNKMSSKRFSSFAKMGMNWGDSTDLASIRLTLKMLRCLSFPSNLLDSSLYDSVMILMESNDSETRKEAVQTILSLLRRGPLRWVTNDFLILRLIEEATTKILMTAISDSDASVRETALLVLDESFDVYLSQVDHIHALFISLNDDVFSIREVALRLICRLADRNAAYILPSLRRLLVQFLMELEYQRTSGRKEETAALLSLLIRECPKMILPYKDPIFRAIMLRIRDPIASVAARSLTALTELIKVCQDTMIPHVNEVMPALIGTLKDQGSMLKREQALEALYYLGSCLGCVMEPYLTYPELLTSLLGSIRSEGTSSARSRATRALGCLGALDPYLQRTLVYEKHVGSDRNLLSQKWPELNKATDSVYSPATPPPISLMELLSTMNPSQEDYYPMLVIHSLMKVLKDSSLNAHHSAVVQAFMSMFNGLGLRCTHYLSYIMPAFIQMLRSVPSNLLDFHLRQLSSLLCMIKYHVRPFADEIIQLMVSFWKDLQITHTIGGDIGHPGPTSDGLDTASIVSSDGISNIQHYSTLVSVIEALSISMESEFRKYAPTVLPLLVDMCERDLSDRRTISGRILHAFAVMALRLEDFVYMILPPILHACERKSLPQELRLHALHVLAYLASQIDCPIIFHQ